MTIARVADLVDEASAERAVADAFAAWGRGEAATTQRVRAAGRDAGMASAMAAVVPPYCGGKLYATNAGRFTFLNVLFDVDGTLLATLDGDVVTALRTAAASALAIRHLAAPHATVATVIGTGRQACAARRRCCCALLPNLAELRICGRNLDAAARLAARASRASHVTVHDDPADAVVGAHVIVTVTSADEPLFPATAVADDALICAVGATKADRAEIEPELVARCAAVVCDDVTGSHVECGDLIRRRCGRPVRLGRRHRAQRRRRRHAEVPRAGDAPVLFETQGVAIQDVAVCGLAYARHAQRSPIQGLGGAQETQEVN